MRIIFSMLFLISCFFQTQNALAQSLETKEVVNSELLFASLDGAEEHRLLAAIDDKYLKKSINGVSKNSKKKVSKNRMTKWQIREEKRKKINMLSGKASWYGTYFHGKKTASGALYDEYMYTSAHRTLPLGTIVEIVKTEDDSRAVVCINDRGPYIKGRAIDVSQKVAKQLNMLGSGVASVTLKVVGDRDGEVLFKDKAFYVSLNGSMDDKSYVGPFTQFADASVMWEALNQVHAKSSIVIDSVKVN